jgi:uncharacterized protein (TIGR03067 family)
MPGGPGGPGIQPQPVPPQPQPQPPPPPPQPQPMPTEADNQDLAKFKGTWTVADGEAAGNKIPEQQLRNAKWVFEGNRVLITEGRQANLGLITINAANHTIDITGQRGGSLGIYELSDDTLKICASPKQRPTDFNTKDVPGCVLYVLKRVPK